MENYFTYKCALESTNRLSLMTDQIVFFTYYAEHHKQHFEPERIVINGTFKFIDF